VYKRQAIKETYKIPENQPHFIVKKKRLGRDPGDVVQVGERVPFVYVYQKPSNDKIKEKIKRSLTADDPVYVKNNNIPIDYEYYVTNQVRKPCEQFLDLIVKDETGKGNSGKIFDEIITKYRKIKMGLVDIGVLLNEMAKNSTGKRKYVLRF
jgi:DNA polymerase elongation subunit (family B)